MEKPKPNLTSAKTTQKVSLQSQQSTTTSTTPQRQIRPAPNFQTIQIVHPHNQQATPLVINNGQIQLPSSNVQSPNQQRLVFLQPIQGQNGQVIYTQSPNAASPQPIQPKPNTQVLIRPMHAPHPVKNEKSTPTRTVILYVAYEKF